MNQIKGLIFASSLVAINFATSIGHAAVADLLELKPVVEILSPSVLPNSNESQINRLIQMYNYRFKGQNFIDESDQDRSNFIQMQNSLLNFFVQKGSLQQKQQLLRFELSGAPKVADYNFNFYTIIDEAGRFLAIDIQADKPNLQNSNTQSSLNILPLGILQTGKVIYSNGDIPIFEISPSLIDQQNGGILKMDFSNDMKTKNKKYHVEVRLLRNPNGQWTIVDSSGKIVTIATVKLWFKLFQQNGGVDSVELN